MFTTNSRKAIFVIKKIKWYYLKVLKMLLDSAPDIHFYIVA